MTKIKQIRWTDTEIYHLTECMKKVKDPWKGAKAASALVSRTPEACLQKWKYMHYKPAEKQVEKVTEKKISTIQEAIDSLIAVAHFMKKIEKMFYG